MAGTVACPAARGAACLQHAACIALLHAVFPAPSAGSRSMPVTAAQVKLLPWEGPPPSAPACWPAPHSSSAAEKTPQIQGLGQPRPSCSKAAAANQASLHPVHSGIVAAQEPRRRAGSEPYHMAMVERREQDAAVGNQEAALGGRSSPGRQRWGCRGEREHGSTGFSAQPRLRAAHACRVCSATCTAEPAKQQARC